MWVSSAFWSSRWFGLTWSKGGERGLEKRSVASVLFLSLFGGAVEQTNPREKTLCFSRGLSYLTNS